MSLYNDLNIIKFLIINHLDEIFKLTHHNQYLRDVHMIIL